MVRFVCSPQEYEELLMIQDDTFIKPIGVEMFLSHAAATTNTQRQNTATQGSLA